MDRDAASLKHEGFTLVEILIALLILSFVALGIAGLFSHSMIVNASGHDYAVLAAESRMALESLLALPFDDVLLLATEGTSRNWDAQSPNFEIEYSVNDYYLEDWGSVATGAWPAADALPANRNLKRITLTVQSTNKILLGNRILTVSSLKIPG